MCIPLDPEILLKMDPTDMFTHVSNDIYKRLFLTALSMIIKTVSDLYVTDVIILAK